MRLRSTLRLLTFLTLSSAGASAMAVDSTTTFQVLLQVTATCNVAASPATDVNFGSQASTTTNVSATGQLNVLCTPGTSYTIALNQGLHHNGTSRTVANGANQLPYQLYRSSGTTQPWTANAGEIHSGTGTGAIQAITVFGVLPSANSAAGSYSDTVTATLTY